MTYHLRLPLLLAAIAALSGCGGDSAPTLPIAVIGQPSDPFASGIRLPVAGQLARAATAEGLVSFDAEGRVVPALADRWIVTDDGLSYIFRLRDGRWSEGIALTGESGREALNQALVSLHGTALGEDLSVIEDVRAMAGRVVEIRLRHPMPELLDLLAQPELALLHKDRGTGPTTAKRDGAVDLLRPLPPERLGLAQPEDWAASVRPARLVALSAAEAVQSFRDGKSEVVLGGTMADYALALGAAGLSRSALRIDPVSGLFGLLVTGTNGPLATPEAREALAMAIDRDALATDLGIATWQPTTRVVPAATPDAPATIGERWIGWDMARRRTEAANRLSRAGVKPGRKTVLRIALPRGPGADALFNLIHADLGAIGITVARVDVGAPAELRLFDAVARYPRVDWYFNQFACAAGRDPCSVLADSKAEQARDASDSAKRSALLEDAEAALTLSNIYIPLGAPVRWSLVRGQLSGFAPNPRGWHPLTPLIIRQN